MKPKVDQEKCIGCAACVAVCPECFEIAENGKAKVKEDCKKAEAKCKEAKESCPVEAIIC